MTHPCDQRSAAVRPAHNVISLAYTPEIIERKRAQRLARAAWREAQDPGHRFVAGMGVCERHKGLCLCKPDGFGTQRVAGPALHKHPAMIALAHVLARAAARAAMLGTGGCSGTCSARPACGPCSDWSDAGQGQRDDRCLSVDTAQEL